MSQGENPDFYLPNPEMHADLSNYMERFRQSNRFAHYIVAVVREMAKNKKPVLINISGIQFLIFTGYVGLTTDLEIEIVLFGAVEGNPFWLSTDLYGKEVSQILRMYHGK